MKLRLIVALVVALTSAAGFAETATDAETDLALILSKGTPATACPAVPQANIRFAAADSSPLAACNATAVCGTFPQQTFIHCSGNSTCQAFDRDCSVGERGRAICDGVTSQCKSCSFCASCIDYNTTCMDCCQCDGATIPFCLDYCGE